MLYLHGPTNTCGLLCVLFFLIEGEYAIKKFVDTLPTISFWKGLKGEKSDKEWDGPFFSFYIFF